MRRALVTFMTVGGTASTLLGAGAEVAGAQMRRQRDEPAARRLLIVSIPYVTWDQLDRVPLPNIDDFVEHPAIADLATRGSGRATLLVDGYLAMGSGGRVYGVEVSDGEQLGVDERFGETTARAAFRARTGEDVDEGIVSLGIVAIREANRESDFDADLGSFPDALGEARIDRAVIANADGAQPDVPILPSAERFRRAAALALVGEDGIVPGGRVDRGLLNRDPAANTDTPFARHLDRNVVLDAFRDVWTDRSVVLVEASDLVLAQVYRPVASETQRDHQLDEALRRTDRLLGALLEEVDLSKDAVLLVAPTPPGESATLTVAGLRGPGVEAGLLRSGTTRRDGFVQLVDVAPAALDLLGVARPTEMDGRPFTTVDDGRNVRDRRDFLVDQAEQSDFRDARITQVQITIVVLTGLVAMMAAWCFVGRGRRVPSRRSVQRVALAVLAFPTATYLVRLVPLHDLGAYAYWPVLLATSAVLAVVFNRAGRSRALDALLVALLAMVAALVIDTVLGTPLQFNSPLGPSPTASRRFGGLTNAAYACLAVSAVIAAPLLAHRIGGTRGARTAVGLLALVAIVDGAPFWGSDVGGVLSLAPGFTFVAILILGWKVRWRTFAWCAAALALGLVAVALIDVSRPAAEQSHLGRLIERVRDNGLGDLLVVIGRKLGANLRTFGSAILGIVLPIALIFVVWVDRRQRPRVERLLRDLPEWRAACAGFAAVAVLGWVLNDSGIAVPGVMLSIFIASFVWLLTRVDVEADRAVEEPANA